MGRSNLLDAAAWLSHGIGLDDIFSWQLRWNFYRCYVYLVSAESFWFLLMVLGAYIVPPDDFRFMPMMVFASRSCWVGFIPTDGFLLMGSCWYIRFLLMGSCWLVVYFFFWSVLVPTSHVRLLFVCLVAILMSLRVREDRVINHHHFVERITCWRHLIITCLML